MCQQVHVEIHHTYFHQYHQYFLLDYGYHDPHGDHDGLRDRDHDGRVLNGLNDLNGLNLHEILNISEHPHQNFHLKFQLHLRIFLHDDYGHDGYDHVHGCDHGDYGYKRHI